MFEKHNTPFFDQNESGYLFFYEKRSFGEIDQPSNEYSHF